MGQNGRLVAEYAGSSKLSKRISLIISGMSFGDMLDIACRTGTESRETLPLWWPDSGVGADGESATERSVEGE